MVTSLLVIAQIFDDQIVYFGGSYPVGDAGRQVMGQTASLHVIDHPLYIAKTQPIARIGDIPAMLK